MQLSYKVSFPGGKEFEQYTFVFTLSLEDVKEQLSGLNLSLHDLVSVMSAFLLIEGILTQIEHGFLTKEDALKKINIVKGLTMLKDTQRKALAILLGENGNGRFNKHNDETR